MAEACAHNKYDEQSRLLRADYNAAIKYRKAGQRTMFPLAVAAVVELREQARKEPMTPERREAIQHGIACGAGACAVAATVKPIVEIVNDGSVDNYQPVVIAAPREHEQTPNVALTVVV